jgi:quercetin dioxygenase-like cupin family protein
MHTHPAGCGIFLVDQTFKFTLESGESPVQENHAGEVVCGDAGAHLPENVADKDAEVILLELKNRKTFDNVQTGKSISVSPASNAPDAIAADSRHYSVQFENDAVRLLRIKFEAGEKSAMHAHPAYCSVILTASVFKMTLADGSVSSNETQPGAVGCVDAEVHLPENTGKNPAEGILIEFKNRQTVKS